MSIPPKASRGWPQKGFQKGSGACSIADAQSEGADILIHEVYSQKGWEGRTPEWQKYHAANHTSGPDVGRIAAQVRPKKLVLYHLLPMGQTEDQVLGEARRNWQGEVIYGKDLEVIR